jgi:oxygen-independent coproporphyrinogen-3 oxidase
MLVNIDQVRKYDVPGPRYTSYPPAVHFRKDLSREAVVEAIRNSPASRDISLYFHLPFCRTLCWYCGCNTVITKNQSQSALYLAYLKKEIGSVAPLINADRRVVQIHFGGGTPTFLLPEELRELGGLIRSNFRIADEVEAGVEIDPRRMTVDHVSALRDAGMNRVSIGVQDFHPKVQEAVNRIQSFEQTKQVVEWMREAGFGSISIDLIYGLPYQTVDSFAATLDKVLSLAPDRLAVFSYAHVPWIKPSQKILERTPSRKPLFWNRNAADISDRRLKGFRTTIAPSLC